MQIKLRRGKGEIKGGKKKKKKEEDTGLKRQRRRKGMSCYQVLPGTEHFQQQKRMANWVWRDMPIIPALNRQSREDLCNLQTSLVYRESSRTIRATECHPVSKPKRGNGKPGLVIHTCNLSSEQGRRKSAQSTKPVNLSLNEST